MRKSLVPQHARRSEQSAELACISRPTQRAQRQSRASARAWERQRQDSQREMRNSQGERHCRLCCSSAPRRTNDRIVSLRSWRWMLEQLRRAGAPASQSRMLGLRRACVPRRPSAAVMARVFAGWMLGSASVEERGEREKVHAARHQAVHLEPSRDCRPCASTLLLRRLTEHLSRGRGTSMLEYSKWRVWRQTALLLGSAQALPSCRAPLTHDRVFCRSNAASAAPLLRRSRGSQTGCSERAHMPSQLCPRVE